MRFTEEHEWIKVEGNVATIGLSSHATEELGEIVFVELPKVGSEFNQMDEIGTVESVKTVSSIYCPVSGQIIEVNNVLEDEPSIINDDPTESGWIFKVDLADTQEVDDLMTEDEYNTYLESL